MREKMSKNLIFALLLLFVSCTNTEKKLESVELEKLDTTLLEKKEGLYFYKGNLYTGKIVKYYNNTNKLELEGFLKEGMLHGDFTTYYASGEVNEKLNIVENKKNGELIKYYKNNNVFLKENYIEGVLSGKYYINYSNGSIATILNIDNNTREGFSIYFYPYNFIKAVAIFDKDRLSGPYFEYYQNGNLFKKLYFFRGKLEGSYREYYINGEKKNSM